MAAFPVTGILGPRQSGKTTLARKLAADRAYPLAEGVSILPVTEIGGHWRYG